VSRHGAHAQNIGTYLKLNIKSTTCHCLTSLMGEEEEEGEGGTKHTAAGVSMQQASNMLAWHRLQLRAGGGRSRAGSRRKSGHLLSAALCPVGTCSSYCYYLLCRGRQAGRADTVGRKICIPPSPRHPLRRRGVPVPHRRRKNCAVWHCVRRRADSRQTTHARAGRLYSLEHRRSAACCLHLVALAPLSLRKPCASNGLCIAC